MTITVNGATRTVAPGLTLGGLLQELELVPEGVAVAVNLHVVPRGQVATRALAEGDQVEVVRAVGGG
jgi:sulfur carrier protein